MESEKEYVTARDVARRWKITHSGVLGLIRGGRLPAIRIGGMYRIPADSVEAYERDNMVGAAT